MKAMPPEMRQPFRRAVAILVPCYVVSFAALADLTYEIYLYYGVSGHAADDPWNGRIWIAVIATFLAVALFIIPARILIRAGFFRPWHQ